MTPSQLEEAARRRYNAVGDTFWTQAEMFDLIYQAQMELALEALAIENVYSTTTVASQQAYPWPTRAIRIKRVTYDGTKLGVIDMREDDAITMLNSSTTSTGTPAYYYLWERSVYLRPVPAAAATLQIWTYDRPQTVTTTSTLDVSEEYHMDLLYFMLAEMSLKDNNPPMEQRYREIWEKRKLEAKKTVRKRLRGDSPAHVKDIDSLPMGGLGTV